MAGFLGCGTVYVDRKVGGVWQGYNPIGNATKFELEAVSELKQRISKGCDTYGQALDSVTIQQPAKLSLMMDELNKENMAIAFLGDASSDTVAASTITDEQVTVVNLDAIVRTTKSNISSLVVKSAATGGTTYTLGTDYVIENSAVGMIKPLSTGTITKGSTLFLDYANATVKSNLIKGGTNPDVKLRYLLVGTNLADQTAVQVEVWESDAAPQSGIDFLSDDYSSIEINGSANIDATKGNPYEVRTEIVNS